MKRLCLYIGLVLLQHCFCTYSLKSDVAYQTKGSCFQKTILTAYAVMINFIDGCRIQNAVNFMIPMNITIKKNKKQSYQDCNL